MTTVVADAREIRRDAEPLLPDQLPGAAPTVPAALRETTHDAGDEILEFRIVFDAADRLDPKRVAGLIRHLRSRLHDISEERFPVLSFVSAAEAKTEAA